MTENYDSPQRRLQKAAEERATAAANYKAPYDKHRANKLEAHHRAVQELQDAAQLARYISHVLLARGEPTDINIAARFRLFGRPHMFGRAWVMSQSDSWYDDTSSKSYRKTRVYCGHALMEDGKVAYYQGGPPTGFVGDENSPTFGIVDFTSLHLKRNPANTDSPQTALKEAAKIIGLEDKFDIDIEDARLFLGAHKINADLVDFGLRKRIS